MDAPCAQEGEYCVLDCADTSNVRGLVIARDPVAEQIALLRADRTVTVLPFDMVLNATPVADSWAPGSSSDSEEDAGSAESGEEVAARRERIAEALQRGGLAVARVDGALVLQAGAAVVRAPYRAEDVTSTNPIVLQRVRALVSE